MRPSLLILASALTLSAQASWFSGSSSNQPAYSSWTSTELKEWLQEHKVDLPSRAPTQDELRDLVAANWNTASAWTYDQYANAQKTFADLRDTSFERWDESRLREFLLEQGVVAPKGPKEQLVLLAKSRYKQYTDAASSFSAHASATASSAIYGNTPHQMSKSASSLASQVTSAAAQATRDVARAFDDSKDYVYSSWDDNQLRTYLEKKNVIKPKSQSTRAELLAKMHEAYGKAVTPVWEAWSTSYIHHWLVSHHVIKSDAETNRDKLTELMTKYYYNTSDSVWHGWSDSELHNWLVKHGYIKTDAQIRREKMIKMNWLVEHGYMRSDAQVKRDELVKAANEKWTDVNAKSAAYLTWPDARLRAYLREHGVSEDMVPGDRPGLLQEVRIRWIQTQTRAEAIFTKIKDIVNGGVLTIEDALHRVLVLLSGGWEETKEKTYEGLRAGEAGYEEAKRRSEKAYYDTKHGAEGTYEEAKKKGEKGYEYGKAKGWRKGEGWWTEDQGRVVNVPPILRQVTTIRL
ncbi:hypothetical protein BDQ17DRAFT_733076 [Cyathus striatus]|nr:hypothetical protein BDQ17DRAFT_733076 [Cyathus striatus]